MDGGHVAFYQNLNIDLLNKLTPYFASPLFNIETDNGYAEAYQHFKFVAIILVFAYLCIVKKIRHFLPWAVLFTYFLLDDSLQLHERLGSVIASAIPITPPFGLRRQDLGELSVTVTAGLLILPSLLWAYYSAQPLIRQIFHKLALLLGLLVVFGVGVDMVHTAFMDHPIISPLLALVEDGGEMLVISLFVSYAFSLANRVYEAKLHLKSSDVSLPALGNVESSGLT